MRRGGGLRGCWGFLDGEELRSSRDWLLVGQFYRAVAWPGREGKC